MQYKTHRKYYPHTPTDYNTKTVSVYTSKKRKNKRCQQFSTARTKHNRTSCGLLRHNTASHRFAPYLQGTFDNGCSL